MKPLCLLILLFLSLHLQAQVHGCTDPLSKNFNPQATVNDGSCEYKRFPLVKPVQSVELSDGIQETSGLIHWGNHLYTHNDDTDTSLYALDTVNGAIKQKYNIEGVINQDWEELAQDSTYIYIGDFDNNHNGNRDNLNIIRITKDSLTVGRPDVQYIYFSYSDKTDLSSSDGDNTDFDCEAMIVGRDSIYLFTKQWKSQRTGLYALPKIPGRHIAQLRATHDVEGLITGATYLEDKKLVVLIGYNKFVRPFFYLLYDFNGTEFFSGNKRKLVMGLRFHQAEGVTTTNGLEYYITNEAILKRPVINTKQQLHKFDLSPYLKDFLGAETAATRRN